MTSNYLQKLCYSVSINLLSLLVELKFSFAILLPFHPGGDELNPQWYQDMGTFSASQVLCEGKPPAFSHVSLNECLTNSRCTSDFRRHNVHVVQFSAKCPFWHTDAWTKRLWFCRQHFPMFSLIKISLDFALNVTEICFQGYNWQ